jgi:large subunit ribosomal protein L24
MKQKYSPSWKSSTQPRKQRKFRHHAPLHIRQKFVHAHLSSELRKKHGTRSARLRTGDKVKIMRGQFRGKTGKVERIDTGRGKIFITGIEVVKKEGSKALCPLRPSSLIIEELNLDDKKRREKYK